MTNQLQRGGTSGQVCRIRWYFKTRPYVTGHGDWVDVAAPGFNIYSTLPGNSYGYKTGTSFATAYVSGLAAHLFSVMTDINENGRLNDEVWVAIESYCH